MPPPRYFYGWVIVVGAIVGQFAAAGGLGQVSGVMLRPMVDDLGWTVGQFTIATSAAFIAGGFAGAVVGPMVDRYGPRPLMIAGAFAYSGALLATSQVTTVWQFVVLQMLAGGIGASLVGPIVVNVAVSRWFVLRRGWAISIGSMGISLAALIMPPMFTAIVDATDWRTGYVTLAALVFVLLIAIAPFMRSSPEAYGLLPDGRDPNAKDTSADQAALATIRSDLDESLTRSQAVRTRSMWLLIVAFGLNMAGLTAMFVHGIPFMTDAGFSRTEASLAFGVTGAANFASKFVWGWALQRFEARNLATGAFVSSTTGILLILVAGAGSTLPLLVVAFLFFGFGFGGTVPISEFLWASYYGRRHLGSVRGFGVPFTILFGSLGPVSVALYFDAVGSYDGAFIGLALTYAVAGLAVWTSRRPTRAAVPAVPHRGPGADRR